MRVIVMMGIPGSGKSTHAKKMLATDQIHNVICPDDIREELTGDAANQNRNQEVFEIAHERLRSALERDEGVVFDATNLTYKAQDAIRNVCEPFNATMELHIMCVPYEVCVERNKARDRVVPEHAMERMTKQFLDSFNHLDPSKWNYVEYIT